jgi:hypothetical protein
MLGCFIYYSKTEMNSFGYVMFFLPLFNVSSA